MTDSIGKAYKPWVIVSLVVLVGSLLMLATVGTVAFLYHQGTDTPLWLVVLGVVAALGVGAGFAGLFLIMVVGGWSSWRAQRRVARGEQ